VLLSSSIVCGSLRREAGAGRPKPSWERAAMKQVTQHFRTGKLAVQELPTPACRPGWLLVATRASLISAGTEKMLMDLASASLAGKAMARPDLVRQVVDKVRREGLTTTLDKVWTKLDTPIPLGYSCAGEALEVGPNVEVRRGERVACAGAGWANHAEYNLIPKNLCVRMPDGLDYEEASFVTLGAIALQGVRQAQPTLGERVVVIGLGLLGLLTVQLLKANGCRVFGFDPAPERARLARELGADATQHDGLAEGVRTFTGGLGADAVVITASTKSDEPVNAAAEIARLKARVVVVGFVGMNLKRDLYYRKELDLRLSMSYGPGRYDPRYEEHGQDYPIAYVRWTEQRNMQTFLELVREGRVTPKALISHRFTIHEAEAAYALLASKEPYLGIVLTYPEERAAAPLRQVRLNAAPAPARTAPLGVGFIGAGNFARSVLLPQVSRTPGVRFTGVATATGISGRHVADKYGFGQVTTDYREILDDPETDAVFIVTRHASHAAIVGDALRAGKAVFVEKPLACDLAQLTEVLGAVESTGGRLMVGFNRRFAPQVRAAKAGLTHRSAPLVALYRVNAGSIAGDSWLTDEEGGGRIIGEVCHFIDTLQFLIGADPVRVHAAPAAGYRDALSIQITFANGSIGTIVYSSLGDPSFPKEYIELFGAGRVVVIDDFRDARFITDGRHKRHRLRRQDKGIAGELEAFFHSLRTGEPMPVPLASLALTTLTTFAIEDSLRTAAPVEIPQVIADPEDMPLRHRSEAEPA
jgi:predicted dehydrogenase/threonine dehydrogenase-like Zn-dependent dehydrogenase